jgi:glycosidase
MRYIVYQLLLRSFLNKTEKPVPFGNLATNGSGTFADIDLEFISHLKSLNVNVLWITGVIRHATTESWPDINIKPSAPELIKGKAGSPYAIIDYFDVNPYLAVNPAQRIQEFKNVLALLKANNIKVIIDFVPNHVSRNYQSLNKPLNFKDFGTLDNQSAAWDLNNDFYYLPGQELVLPVENYSGIKEFPAKATGNNCFKPNPNAHDWYETVKLNYGWNPYMPQSEIKQTPVWDKILTILEFWISLGVDGFRCDMADMIPIEFWYWAIDKVQLKHPNTIFIAESYSKDNYSHLIDSGFTLLYDKVGAYNCVESVLKLAHPYNLQKLDEHIDFTYSFKEQMLRFSENHDEVRLSAPQLAADCFKGFAATALLFGTGNEALMLYNGQEFGEAANETTGYSGNDGKSTIYDFANVPSGFKWKTKQLSSIELQLEKQYANLLKTIDLPVFNNGNFYNLGYCNGHLGDRLALIYIWLRYYNNSFVIGITNLAATPIAETLYLNAHSLEISGMHIGSYHLKDLLEISAGSKLDVFNNENEAPYGQFLVYIAPSTTAYYQLIPNVE